MLETLTKQFSHKIRTLDELRAIVQRRPRKKRVMLCYGAFDVVHPGHLRHLLYAKSKADLLVVSIASDAHIVRESHRPHIPQDLRALNLAAFEIVDYVLVETEPTPVNTILKLQPDFYAKGYEYNATTPQPKTQQEIDALHSYGGEIIFTPGDVTYSATKLSEVQPKRLRFDKLTTLMQEQGLTFDSLRHAVEKLSGRRIHVVGDTIVDTLTRTAMIGGSMKTPTMSVLFESKTDYVGGAGIVAKHLQAAGADVVYSTVVGDDALKDFVLADLAAAGVDCRAVIDETRPTTNKNSIVADNYRLLKIDTLDNRTISEQITRKLVNEIQETKCEAVVLSDFRHGMFNRRTIPRLVRAIPKGVYKVADSQVASRWGNITEFKNFDLITPNEREARFAPGDQDSGVRPLAASLYEAAQCATLIMKMGSRGILACGSGKHDDPDANIVLDSFVDELVDAVGAGDALLSYATLSMLATGSTLVSAILGSMAAACECERDGNIPITPEFVLKKIDDVAADASHE